MLRSEILTKIDEQPFALMTLRGRAYLRTQLDAPDPKAVAATLALFEIGVLQALRVVGGGAERAPEATGRSTAWQSFPPGTVAGDDTH